MSKRAETKGAPQRREEILRVFQSRKETRAYYDKISKVYDLLAEKSEGPVRAAGLKELDAKSGEDILEIGFGTGHCLTALAAAVAPGGRIYGIDLSVEMLKTARKKLRRGQFDDRVQLVCGDATLVPFPAALVDAVFMSFTLELFDTPDIPDLLAECRRILRPRGRIVVVGMSKEGQSSALLHAYEWTHRHFPNFLDCRPIFVRQALEAAGFHIIRAIKQKMWVPVEIVLATVS
jgi:ubiquinone/menaquinone biosynthesis C-methylase UbiE